MSDHNLPMSSPKINKKVYLSYDQASLETPCAYIFLKLLKRPQQILVRVDHLRGCMWDVLSDRIFRQVFLTKPGCTLNTVWDFLQKAYINPSLQVGVVNIHAYCDQLFTEVYHEMATKNVICEVTGPLNGESCFEHFFIYAHSQFQLLPPFIKQMADHYLPPYPHKNLIIGIIVVRGPAPDNQALSIPEKPYPKQQEDEEEDGTFMSTTQQSLPTFFGMFLS